MAHSRPIEQSLGAKGKTSGEVSRKLRASVCNHKPCPSLLLFGLAYDSHEHKPATNYFLITGGKNRFWCFFVSSKEVTKPYTTDNY